MHTGRYETSAPAAPREPTINERLNRTAEALHEYCDRIEAVLSRVNGTPQSEKRASDVAQIRPTVALSQAVETLEGVQKRLCDLAIGVERIA